MDRKISARSRLLVKSVMDKSERQITFQEQTRRSIQNARNDLFDQPSNSPFIQADVIEDFSTLPETEPYEESTGDKNVPAPEKHTEGNTLSSVHVHAHRSIVTDVINQTQPDSSGRRISQEKNLFLEEGASDILPGSSSVTNNKVAKTTQLVNYSDSDESNMDYSSDDAQNDPDFLPISDDDENASSLTRWKKRRTDNWKVNIIKQKRAAGLPYKNKTKECPAKKPKLIDCSKCRFDCSTNFTEKDRESFCQSYWELKNYDRQKDFLLNHVQAMVPKRRTDNGRPRQVSKVYYLQNSNGRHRVCASFFEKTLCISNGPINTALRGKTDTGFFNKPDGRGRKTPGNKTPEDSIAYVKSHIESFPYVEAHYVRQSSKKLYLDPLLNIRKMYELYKEMCEKTHRSPVKEPIYRRIFGTEYNLSFHVPKKDQCASCSKYKTADEKTKKDLEAEYSLHLIRKAECNEAKANDKERAKADPKFKTITFDLQSVLQLPFSAVSTFYYLRKLCIYNLTIYDEDGEAICNVWSEVNGKRGSNEIGSIILRYIQNIPENVTHLSMFSDTCSGQNRNQQMAAVLLFAVQHTHMEVIEQKFLESGHSHMECDSMHSAIEYSKKHREIFMMRDWIEVFKQARSKRGNINNNPYKVDEWKFQDFWDLHELAATTIKNRTHDVEGEKVSWLKIKCLKFEKAHPYTIFYRYNHTSAYKKIDVSLRSRRNATQNVVLKQAYNHSLPISLQKKKDLEKLCRDGLIPIELHEWYKSLPVSTTLQDAEIVDE